MQLKPEELRTVLHLDYWRDEGPFSVEGNEKNDHPGVFPLCL